MRNLFIAFGLTFFFAVTAMAAPSNPTAMMIGMFAAAKAEPCVNQAWNNLSSPEQMLECEMIFETPESNRKYTLAALKAAQHETCAKVPSSKMMECFDLYHEAQKVFKSRVSLLILKGYTKMADDMYPRKLSPCPKSFSKELCKSVQWPQEAGFGHAGGILLILFTLLWGRGLTSFVLANEKNKGTHHPFDNMWPACRTMVIAIVGIIIVLSCGGAYGACTDVEIAGNEVAAQYGLKLYDCDDKNEVPQVSKDAVFNVIWNGYKAKGGYLTKAYIKTRWERAESAFWAVWKGAPLWQAKIAAAICAKETLCGVTIKFSEWENYHFENKNLNGTTDCGIAQINSGSTTYTCDQLQDLETAFKEQKRIIILKVGGSNKKAVWKKRIHRYNGGGTKAKKYGQLIMSWAK